jgi:RES domain-containing protein
VVRAWRIVHRRYAASAFDGEGARKHGGRWNSPGRPAVYLASSRALALLEVLVHLEDEAALAAYVLFEVEAAERDVEVLDADRLPRGWRRTADHAPLRALGDAWLESRRGLLLALPSAIIPQEQILLLNPLHPRTASLRIGPAEELGIDPRLLRAR